MPSYSEVLSKKIQRIERKLQGYQELQKQLDSLRDLQSRAEELDDLMNKVAPTTKRGPRKGTKKKK